MKKFLQWRSASRHIISGRCLSTATTFSNLERSPSPPSMPKPWLFVGLGNPGEKFMGTRHNVGFDMIDCFANSVGIPMASIHCKAFFGQGLVDGTPVLLAKPQTYMNLSGESAGPLAAYYKLPLDRVVVIFDDMTLPCGVLRLQLGGGHGRHIGLKNVVCNFRGNKQFGRLRIGIGQPPGQMDPKAFVLQKFSATGRDQIDTALREGSGILKTVLLEGLVDTSKKANPVQKYKYHRIKVMK
ncbi:peptidyl-tRNA hydrolase family protein isoform X2 [Wolffia australiana]